MEPTNNPQPSTNPESEQAAAAGTGVDNATTAAGMTATETATPRATPAAPGGTMETGATSVDTAAVASTDTSATSGAVIPPAPVDTTATPTAPVVGAGTAQSGFEGLSMTEPIMQPDLPPAPDPVKQELESPMKAAGPVPGSIGSAMSVTQDGTQLDANGQPIVAEGTGQPSNGAAVANVAFNDPAKQPDGQKQPGALKGLKKPIKLDFKKFNLKNINRATLVAFIVVAVMVVIVLATVLVVQIMS